MEIVGLPETGTVDAEHCLPGMLYRVDTFILMRTNRYESSNDAYWFVDVSDGAVLMFGSATRLVSVEARIVMGSVTP